MSNKKSPSKPVLESSLYNIVIIYSACISWC